MRVYIHPRPGMPRPGGRARRFLSGSSFRRSASIGPACVFPFDAFLPNPVPKALPAALQEDRSRQPFPAGNQRNVPTPAGTRDPAQQPAFFTSLGKSSENLPLFRDQSAGPGPIIQGPIMPEPIIGQEPVMPMPMPPRPIPPRLLITGYMRSASASCMYMFTCSR